MADVLLGEIATTSDTLQIEGFKEQEARLVDMEAKAQGGLVWNCQTREGDKAAREWRKSCVTLRTSLKDTRLAITRKLDEEKKRYIGIEANIEGRIRFLEEMADAPIKAEEKRKADEEAAKAKIEQARVANIRTNIDAIALLASPWPQRSSDEIREAQKLLRGFTIDESYAEFTQEAHQTKAAVADALATMLAQAVQREEEARIAAVTARKLAELEAAEAIRKAEQAEADRVARIEADRIAAENAKALKEANEKLAKAEAEREAELAASRERERAAEERLAEANRKIAEAVAKAEAEAARVAEQQSQIEYHQQEEAEADRQRQSILDAQNETSFTDRVPQRRAPGAPIEPGQPLVTLGPSLGEEVIVSDDKPITTEPHGTLQPHVHCGEPGVCCCPEGRKAFEKILFLADSLSIADFRLAAVTVCRKSLGQGDA